MSRVVSRVWGYGEFIAFPWRAGFESFVTLPRVARPTQHGTERAFPADPAPQIPTPRCEARSARYGAFVPCTPGLTKFHPTLRGLLRTLWSPRSLQTRPHNTKANIAGPTPHAMEPAFPAHQAPQIPTPRCEAHSAGYGALISCRPGPASPNPTLRGLLRRLSVLTTPVPATRGTPTRLATSVRHSSTHPSSGPRRTSKRSIPGL